METNFTWKSRQHFARISRFNQPNWIQKEFEVYFNNKREAAILTFPSNYCHPVILSWHSKSFSNTQKALKYIRINIFVLKNLSKAQSMSKIQQNIGEIPKILKCAKCSQKNDKNIYLLFKWLWEINTIKWIVYLILILFEFLIPVCSKIKDLLWDLRVLGKTRNKHITFMSLMIFQISWCLLCYLDIFIYSKQKLFPVCVQKDICDVNIDLCRNFSGSL